MSLSFHSTVKLCLAIFYGFGQIVPMPRAPVRTKHRIVAAIEAELIKRVRLHNGLSRSELARAMHLAPSTAGIYVDRLFAEGFLMETDRAERGYGRRPKVVVPHPSAGKFIGIDFEATSLMTTVVDFSLQVVARFHRTIPLGESVEQILRRIEEAIQQALKEHRGPLLGIGVGVPGMIDAARGVASHYRFIPEWKDVPVAQRLADAFKVPVQLENNIRSMAMAEFWLGQGRGLRNFLCLGIRTGIGVAVVLDGEVLQGSQGAAGEIGSWPALAATRNGVVLRAQTLEEAGSLHPILQSAGKALGRTCTLADLRTAVESGDRRVRAVLEDAASIHGVTIRQLYLLFNPERIIVVGPLADLGAALLTPLASAVGKGLDDKTPAIVNSTFGQFGGALGAAALAVHRWKPKR